MLRHILKKDLLKRKGVNFILLIFITLSTIFLASSVNNIMVVNSGVNYYLKYSHVPDLNLVFTGEDDKAEVDEWLDQKKADGKLNAYDYNNLLVLPEKNITVTKTDKDKRIDTDGATLFLGKMDVDYNKVFDQDGKEFSLKNGEIGLGSYIMELNHLAVGDKVKIVAGDTEKEFVIKEQMKDAAFGNSMVSMSRMILNDHDYALYENSLDKFGIYYIDTDDDKALGRDITDKGFKALMNQISLDTYQKIYVFDMILAALLILIGICLILIALLVLRFTLVFTMEEQYQEIGIMKAIGFRNLAIKKIYLMKYLLIVSVGAILGLFLSIPVSQMMIESVSSNMIMNSGDANFMVNVLCAGGIVLLVLGFCYFSTRKLNKVSAITAIRNGQDGERFTKFSRLHLSKRKKMSVSVYLGLNDILSHVRRYAVLIVTFCISFVLVTIPMNTLTTMKSSDMINRFMLNPDSSVYVRKIEASNESRFTSNVDVRKAMDRIKGELVALGYEDIEMTNASLYLFVADDAYGVCGDRIDDYCDSIIIV